MKTNTSLQHLSSQIAQVIQEHIAALHQEAASALEQAFGSAAGARIKPPQALRSHTPTTQRTSAEITALGEQLYQLVCAKPGETMTVLAAEVSARAGDLHRPMMNLKRAGKIRSVGQRHFTRYFPLVNEKKDRAA